MTTATLKLRCPACLATIPLALTVGSAERNGDGYTLPVSCDADAANTAIVEHVMAAPHLHPAWLTTPTG